MNTRETKLSNWLSQLFPKKTLSLQELSGDASFRRYFRCYHPEGTYIIMDAPPEKNNDCVPFSLIDNAFLANNINVPKIHHSDLKEGFMLLEDFGDTTYLQAFKTENPHKLYQDAIDALIRIQGCQQMPDYDIPYFDANFMINELEQFDDWFVHQLLGSSLNRAQQCILNEAYERLIQSAVYQPQVLIHRDYHSRNLMFTGLSSPNSPGILDFQDAMIGPITYDLVSLLRDCYINWPDSLVDTWVDYYFHQAKNAKLMDSQITETQFSHAFDLMGMQRHLKATFIFSRLHLKYERSSYLNDISRTMQYVLDASSRYEEFEAFHWLLQNVIMPKFHFPETPSFRREMKPRTTVAAISSFPSTIVIESD